MLEGYLIYKVMCSFADNHYIVAAVVTAYSLLWWYIMQRAISTYRAVKFYNERKYNEY